MLTNQNLCTSPWSGLDSQWLPPSHASISLVTVISWVLVGDGAAEGDPVVPGRMQGCKKGNGRPRVYQGPNWISRGALVFGSGAGQSRVL